MLLVRKLSIIGLLLLCSVGGTPSIKEFLKASADGDVVTVKKLLEAGVDFNERETSDQGKDGFTALHKVHHLLS
jgi:hypothetical protein